jgi:DNA replication protein DnaC
MSDTNIPEQFRGVRLSDYDTARGDPRILESLEKWKPSLERPSLALVGPPGVAKTILACAELNEQQAGLRFKLAGGGPVPADSQQVLRQQRVPVYFITLAELIQLEIQSIKLFDLATKGEERLDEWQDIDRLLTDLRGRVKYLVIDDVGKEYRTASGFAVSTFENLARTRHNQGLATIYTSNLPLERWLTLYSPSMENFIRRSSLVVTFRKQHSS